MSYSSRMKSIVLGCTLMAQIPFAHANSFMNILDNVMATINPNAGLVGPIYRHETKSQDKYGDEIAKILLKEAHRQANRYYQEGNKKAYYAFMNLALTVPVQEGLLVHFRQVPAQEKYCRDKRSQGEKIKSSKAQKQFQRTLNNRGLLRDKDNGFLVPCSKITGTNTYNQLIVGGADGSDVGIMQLSALWHYEEFLKEVKYASVESTVRYGLGYIKKRFNSNFRKASDPSTTLAQKEASNISCIVESDGAIDYEGLIRGSWSAYNGGPSQFCRFADTNSEHAGKDRGFKKNLEATLELNNGRFFGWNEDGKLPISDLTKRALAEVADNFEKGTDNRAALSQIIGE